MSIRRCCCCCRRYCHYHSVCGSRRGDPRSPRYAYEDRYRALVPVAVVIDDVGVDVGVGVVGVVVREHAKSGVSQWSPR